MSIDEVMINILNIFIGTYVPFAPLCDKLKTFGGSLLIVGAHTDEQFFIYLHVVIDTYAIKNEVQLSIPLKERRGMY